MIAIDGIGNRTKFSTITLFTSSTAIDLQASNVATDKVKTRTTQAKQHH
jgi:hypothetical protein